MDNPQVGVRGSPGFHTRITIFLVYIINLPEGLMSVAKLFMQVILHFFL